MLRRRVASQAEREKEREVGLICMRRPSSFLVIEILRMRETALEIFRAFVTSCSSESFWPREREKKKNSAESEIIMNGKSATYGESIMHMCTRNVMKIVR